MYSYESRLAAMRAQKIEHTLAKRKQNGYTFPMGLDTTQAIFKKYATNYIPRNFLVDRDGKVVKASVGYDDAEFAALVKLIEKEIKK